MNASIFKTIAVCTVDLSFVIFYIFQSFYEYSLSWIIIKIHTMFFSALFALLAVNIMMESKELVCTEIGKTKSPLVTYHTVPGKKGACGIKRFKGEPAGINEQELEKLESKNFFLVVFMRQLIFDNYI